MYRDEAIPVYVLAYAGRSVPANVGTKFCELVDAIGSAPHDCPVLAATRLSAANALGLPTDADGYITCRLAAAVGDYHFAADIKTRMDALEEIQKVLLDLEGHTAGKTYQQALSGIEARSWRPVAIRVATALRYAPGRFAAPDDWLGVAHRTLAPFLPPGQSIRKRLRRHKDLARLLSCDPRSGHPGRTIHSVKGKQFPAVCVVLSTAKAKGIIDYLSTGTPATNGEDARKLYVGASRAQQLLAIAAPKSQAARLADIMVRTGASVSSIEL